MELKSLRRDFLNDLGAKEDQATQQLSEDHELTSAYVKLQHSMVSLYLYKIIYLGHRDYKTQNFILGLVIYSPLSP